MNLQYIKNSILSFLFFIFLLIYFKANIFSNKIASYFKLQNFERTDTIALFMDARPEYSCIWLGLSKLGIITALINSNLRKESLAHSIKVAKSKAIIVGSELAECMFKYVIYILLY